jgi:hypothetical protein
MGQHERIATNYPKLLLAPDLLVKLVQSLRDDSAPHMNSIQPSSSQLFGINKKFSR